MLSISSVAAGKFCAKDGASAQCVVARLPSRRPAAASGKAPVQIEPCRRARGRLAQPADQRRVAQRGDVAISARDQKRVDRASEIGERGIGNDGKPQRRRDRIGGHGGDRQTVQAAPGQRIRHGESFHRAAHIHRHDIRIDENDDVAFRAGRSSGRAHGLVNFCDVRSRSQCPAIARTSARSLPRRAGT